MAILNLALANFRNFSSKHVQFDHKLTVIIGPNGSGKSNILEAIALLSGIRSSRVETDLDLIKFTKSEAKIESKVASSAFAGASTFTKASVDKSGDRQSEEKVLTINFVVVDELHVKKAYFVDSIKKRLADFVDYSSIVIFHPQDLELVTGPPALRRHHLDLQLSAVDRDYHRAITFYNKIVVRRNKVLGRVAEGSAKQNELDFWDERLLEHGKYITAKREEFFQYLNFVEKSIPTAVKGNLTWELVQSTVSRDKLIKNRERDITAGVTLSGPHRDDFRFIFNGRDLSYFGSRGEMRMAVLALKLTELEYWQVKNLSRPILALDDIFSELDWEHRDAVLSIVDKQQTIITAAEKESVPKNLFKKAKVINL